MSQTQKRRCVVVFYDYGEICVYTLKTFNYQFELIGKNEKRAFYGYQYVSVRNKQTMIVYKACLEILR